MKVTARERNRERKEEVKEGEREREGQVTHARERKEV